MRKIKASADEIVGLFDQKIEEYLAEQRPEIERKFRQKAGEWKLAPSEEEFDSFLKMLADSLYDNLEFDQGHLERFVSFYVNPKRLDAVINEELSNQFSLGTPTQVAARLRQVAQAIDNSQSPDRELVIKAIKEIKMGLV